MKHTLPDMAYRLQQYLKWWQCIHQYRLLGVLCTHIGEKPDGYLHIRFNISKWRLSYVLTNRNFLENVHIGKMFRDFFQYIFGGDFKQNEFHYTLKQ